MRNPELESLGQLVVDFKIVLATIGTGAKLYTLLPFPWITLVTWRGGPVHGQQPVFHITIAQTSGTWTGWTWCMDNSLSSISPLPRPAPWRDFSRLRSMATHDRGMPHRLFGK